MTFILPGYSTFSPNETCSICKNPLFSESMGREFKQILEEHEFLYDIESNDQDKLVRAACDHIFHSQCLELMKAYNGSNCPDCGPTPEEKNQFTAYNKSSGCLKCVEMGIVFIKSLIY